MNTLDAVFRVVLDLSWRTSWLILAFLLLRAALQHRTSARLIFVAWIAISLRLLLPVSWAAPWSPFRGAPWSFFSAGAAPTANVAVSSALSPAAAASDAGPSVLRASSPAPSSDFPWSPQRWAAIAWLGGVGFLCLARLFAHARFRRRISRCRVALAPTTAARISTALPPTGFTPLDVVITAAVPAPALHGILRPQLLFPPGFVEALSATELTHTLAHEAAHHRRRDLLVRALIRTAAVVHWFNPLAWVLLQLSRADCELACDETALRATPPAERKSYGAALLAIVRLTSGRPLPSPAVGVIESKRHLKQRIQMIVADRPSSLLRALLATALFLAAVAFTLTREGRAQESIAVPLPSHRLPVVPADSPLSPAQAAIVYGPATDGLDALFPNGIAASVGDQTVTVADIRRELEPLIYQLKRESKNQGDFDLRVSTLQNSVLTDLVKRIVLLKKFHQHKEGEPERRIDAGMVDRALDDELKERFGGDRQKMLDYMRERGVTIREYRQMKEDEIIYGYMRAQERKLSKPPMVNRADMPGAFHLRLIQLKRTDAETDATLLAKANAILQRFRNGETFATLAQESSDDIKRAKGGDWGWMIPSDIKPNFQTAIATLKPGDVSEPILLPEGCFLMFIEARR